MGGRNECRRWKAAAITAALLLTTCAAQTVKDKAKQSNAEPVPAPVARIAVEPLGFLAPSSAYLQMRLAWSSLNFIDKDHLLFTFHVNQLLQRTPLDTRNDADQMIRAVVLDIGSGKALRQEDWRMYDRGRYIWALKDGQFLVRRRNALYLTDSTLDLKPYLMFQTDLQGVEVSPGRTLLMLELKKVLPGAEGDGAEDAPSLRAPGEGQPRESGATLTQMVLLRPGERKALATGPLRVPRAVPLLEDGVLETLEGDSPKQWVVEKQTVNKTIEKVGKLRSDCSPELQTLSPDVVLARGCPPHGGDGSSVVALKLNGAVLWQDHWASRYIWPTFEYAEDGSRFAYESLQANRDIGSMDSFGEADIVAQPVGVFDTETGKLVLVENADPILSEGQNYALSADGRRFAILRRGAIEVYDLPPVGKQ